MAHLTRSQRDQLTVLKRAGHNQKEISNLIGCDHSTVSRELGRLNEWTNRELRRFFPKGCDFRNVRQKEVNRAVDWLNNCPRKSLQYRTPKEVFEEQLGNMRLGL